MSRPSCPRRFRTRSDGDGSGDPDAVFLHDLSIELDASAGTEVLDDVPVDRRLVPPADVVEAEAERDVDGAVHLLVEVDVPHVAGDPGVAADPELADPAGALVGVERLEQEVFFALRGRLDDPALREAEADAPELAAVPHRREPGEVDRSLSRRLHRADKE